MKIYISGPITGHPPEQVKQAFEAAAERIRSKGHEPVNPYLLQNILAPETTTWNQYMVAALALLDVSAAICMLPGWTNSSGASLEHRHALGDRKRIFYTVSEIQEAAADDCGNDCEHCEWATCPKEEANAK